MNDVITIGEAMIAFSPQSTGPMKYVNMFEKKVGGAELNLAIGCSRSRAPSAQPCDAHTRI